MRVLFVTPYYYPEVKFGGPPRKIHSLSTGLVNRGHSVRVVTFGSEWPGGHDNRNIDGVTVQYLSWIGRNLWQWPTNRSVLTEAVASSDVIHGYGLYNLLCPMVTQLATKLQKPFLLEPLGMYPARTGRTIAKHIFNLTFTKRMIRRASAVVAASELEVRDLEAIAPSSGIVYRRNGLDVDRFKNLPDRTQVRRRYQIPSSTRVILYLGRLSPIKNLEQLILAFGQANIEDAQLLLAGPLHELAYVHRLRNLISERNLDLRVKITGPLYEEDQRVALGGADLFVLPSLSESFGNAAAEAVAAGVPVLLTDTCGFAPIIHQRAGLTVPLGVDSLANGLQMMLENAEFRNQMTARRNEVLSELSWDEPIAQTIALYERIVAHGRM